MKFTLVVLSVVCVGCLAAPVEVEQNKVQKRSIGGDEWLGGYYGGSYGLSAAALSVPSISSLSLSAPSISSHTHSHSTAVIDRPYPVPIHTPSITSAAILPSTHSSYNYGLSSYPYNFGYPSSYGSSYSSPYVSSYGSYGSLGYAARSYNPGYGKYYSRSYPSIYKKSYYSSPSYKYKW